MPRIPEKAVDLLATTGFAAAGVVSVVAQNLRTIADRDEALTDRAKQVAQNSLGAVLGGPAALTERGRQLVGRDGGSADDGRNGDRSTGAGADGAGSDGDRSTRGTDAAKTTAKTVAPDERPDRSKAEEARDRDVQSAERVTAESEPAAKKEPEAKNEPAAKKKQPAKKKKIAPKEKAAAKKKPAEKKPAEKAAGKTETAAEETAERSRSVEEQRAAERTAKKQKQAKANGKASQKDDSAPLEGLPADVDENLVADLQRMTIKQLRDRAAQDGLPNRTNMSKDELVVALATRESEAVKA